MKQLTDALAAEHSKKQINGIVKYIGSNPLRFEQLMKIMFSNQKILSQRAAWVMSGCIEHHPYLLRPYVGKVIRTLELPFHDAVKRNILRILQHQNIPERLQGRLTNVLFSLLQSPDEPIAVKAFGMTVLCNICKKHPDLKNELAEVIKTQLPYSSPGLKSRSTKVLKEIDSFNSNNV